MFLSPVLCLWDEPKLDPVTLEAFHAFPKCPFLAQMFFVAQMGAPEGTKKPVWDGCCRNKPLAPGERAASQDCAND